ncbi:5-methylthioadenosine/S-adenosylhomocysteine deaminase [Alicyclobacillus cellulosilyticus]|uniref:5-methylthioadenosine/S-adenosylhomocysteine deaminase n=1 Tax=Alicyclobacillus cellulosilyticus TaxID=1003997 RepID=A0A917NK68_9BACL|nr:amidohydrolase [Alicyclobacillus cellulosilyticus]GGJ07304.1 5-methylthioadenosine/S-adenosylhomocysteine deaminase [Alicyclobacillus cellulosilyticus]
MRTLLTVGAVIQSSESWIDGPAHIVIEDDRIAALAAGPYAGPQSEFDLVIRRPHALALPGLINAHGHAAMTLLRGVGDDVPLFTWLHERIFPLEAKLTGEAVYWGTLLACWEMIRSGTTCFTDMYMMMDHAAQAAAESGLRAVLSWGMVGLDEASAEAGIRNTRRFAAAWHKAADGRITVTLGPHAPYTCPPAYLTRVAELSAELGLPIQIHLAETRQEVADSLARYGASPIVHADRCGLFAHPVLAAHCVHVDDDDIAILQHRGVRVAHNPQSNLKLASGVAPVARMRAAGVTVGLGTDGAASNNNLDMFEEMRLAATLHKGVHEDAAAIPAREAFAMATELGARAVFLPEGHGTLAPGQPADIVLLDMTSPHFIPPRDLLSHVVYAAGADDVTDVFVAGRMLMAKGEVLTLDTERIRYEVRRLVSLFSGSS